MLPRGAREENILYGSVTDEQRSGSAKDRQPDGLSSGGRLAALLLSHRARRLCSRRQRAMRSLKKNRPARNSRCAPVAIQY